MKYLITLILILGMIFSWGLASADDKIQINFKNTTEVTKIMRLNLMDQPCYVDRYGRIKCYQNRITSEMRPDDDTVSTHIKVGRNVGERYCVEWTNLSSNPDKFKSGLCFLIEEDIFEINITPEVIIILPLPEKV